MLRFRALQGSSGLTWPEPDFSRLPLRIEKSGKRLGTIFAVMGAIFLCGFAWLLLNLVTDTGHLKALGVGAAGLGFLAVGLYYRGRRVEIDIDRQQVRCRAWRGRKETQWSVALSDFRGVLRRSFIRGRGKNRARIHVVELLHDEPSKTLVLYESQSEERIRPLWESASRRLDLPALIEGPDGLTKRAPQDLDTPLRDLPAADEAASDFDLETAPPPGVSWERLPDRLLLRIHGRMVPWPISLVLSLFLGLALWVLVSEGGSGLPFVAPILLVGIGVLGWDLVMQRRIEITPDRLEYFWSGPGGPYRRKSLPLAEIETVTQRRIAGRKAPSLVVESDHASIAVSGGLSRRALAWLEQFITAAIARAPRDGGTQA